MDVLRVALGMVLSIVLPWMVQLIDRRLLRARGRDAPWNVASWGTALYAFGPLSMLAWSQLSRGRPWRWLVGPGWSAALLLVVLRVSSAPDAKDLPAGPLDWLLSFAGIVLAGAMFLMLLDGVMAVLGKWRGAPNGDALRADWRMNLLGLLITALIVLIPLLAALAL